MIKELSTSATCVWRHKEDSKHEVPWLEAEGKIHGKRSTFQNYVCALVFVVLCLLQ